MTKRSHYLTALLLALWLPSQALATVLVHCVTTATDAVTSHVMETSHASAAVEDCHGKADAQTAQTDPVATTGHHDANAADCFHCTGGCHKLQPMMTLERESQRTTLQTSGPATRANELASGYPDFPIRPPQKHPFSLIKHI